MEPKRISLMLTEPTRCTWREVLPDLWGKHLQLFLARNLKAMEDNALARHAIRKQDAIYQGFSFPPMPEVRITPQEVKIHKRKKDYMASFILGANPRRRLFVLNTRALSEEERGILDRVASQKAHINACEVINQDEDWFLGLYLIFKTV